MATMSVRGKFAGRSREAAVLTFGRWEGGTEGTRSDPRQLRVKGPEGGRGSGQPRRERDAPVTGSGGEQRVSPYFHPSSSSS